MEGQYTGMLLPISLEFDALRSLVSSRETQRNSDLRQKTGEILKMLGGLLKSRRTADSETTREEK